MNPTIREQAKNVNPNKSVTELAKILGAQWKMLSSEDKEPYQQAYLDEKAQLNSGN